MTPELKAKVEEYLKKAGGRFENLEISDVENIDEKKLEKIKVEFRDMALGYYSDARHFYEKEEYINALAALEYAEGWLDGGKAMGIFR